MKSMKDLPKEELKMRSHIMKNYFEEAGEEKEEQVIKELVPQRRSRG